MAVETWTNSNGDYYYISSCGYIYTIKQRIQNFIIVEDDVLGKCVLLKRRKKLTNHWPIYEYSLPCEHVDQRKQDKIRTTITELITQLFAEDPQDLSFEHNYIRYATESNKYSYYTSSIPNLELKDPQEYLLYPLNKWLQSKLLNHIKISDPSEAGLSKYIIKSSLLSTIKNQEEIPVPYEKSFLKRFVKKLKNLLS